MSSTVGDVGSVAIEHFVADGQAALGSHDQTDVDLLAVGPVVARAAAFGLGVLGVAGGIAFKIRAGDVVEQELELDAEPALVAGHEVFAQGVFVAVQGRRDRGRADCR